VSTDDLIGQMYALVNDYRRVKDPSMVFSGHEVARRLRDRYPDRPDVWASLIHAGP
jgi:hypothetical protein